MNVLIPCSNSLTLDNKLSIFEELEPLWTLYDVAETYK